MNAALSKKLRFSDVAYAIDSTPKALRLWLQRGLVVIDTPQPAGGGWTEYSFRDIAILAFVRALVNFGVEVPAASAIANKALGDHFFPELKGVDPDRVSAGALAIPWINRRLYIHRDGDAWCISLVDLWKTELGIDPRLPSSLSLLRREFEPAPVFVSVDVESVLLTAFKRANESLSAGEVTK